jgi:hypothetical protein
VQGQLAVSGGWGSVSDMEQCKGGGCRLALKRTDTGSVSQEQCVGGDPEKGWFWGGQTQV